MNTLRAGSVVLEPLEQRHAGEMFVVLSDPEIHRFTDLAPPESLEHLRTTYALLEGRASPDGKERWLNWIMVLDGRCIGVVQATVLANGQAWVAYQLARAMQRRGIARASVQAMLDELRSRCGVREFMACVEAENLRSVRLLDALGFHEATADERRGHALEPTERLFLRAAGPVSGSLDDIVARPAPRFIPLAGIDPTPWRNGKGTTRELIAWPDADAWQLRFSVADIESDGPFSPWPEVARSFCVLDGVGVVLSWSDGRKQRLQPGTPPLAFDGGDPPWAQLIDGPTRDLNLMTRGQLDAALEVVDGRPRARPWACFAAEAGCLDIDGDALDMPACTLAWFDPAPSRATFDRRGWWIARTARAAR
jgi:hypothetical protein